MTNWFKWDHCLLVMDEGSELHWFPPKEEKSEPKVKTEKTETAMTMDQLRQALTSGSSSSNG